MKKVLNVCEKHGFLKPFGVGSQTDHFRFGPAGEFLTSNIRHEWMYSNVINREENIFPFHNVITRSTLDWTAIREPFLHAKSISNGQLPFGLALSNPYQCGKSVGESVSDSSSCVRFPWKTALRLLLFVSPNDGRQYFYKWQQNRKMWWRKFSAYPGRFSLSDVKETSLSDSKNMENGIVDQRVDILAKFDWGISNVETVQVYSINSIDQSSELLEDFRAKNGRTTVNPCVVESVMDLEEASLVFLCDALSETSTSRRLLRLHRRLAPYKVGFVASSKDLSVGDKLKDFAHHLSFVLRRAGLTTLLLPDSTKKSLDSQLLRNDEMGIPFTVILAENSLTDGIAHLYSRETTLKEQVHISQLSKYLELLMKNY